VTVRKELFPEEIEFITEDYFPKHKNIATSQCMGGFITSACCQQFQPQASPK
jgi:hypothetical protein